MNFPTQSLAGKSTIGGGGASLIQGTLASIEPGSTPFTAPGEHADEAEEEIAPAVSCGAMAFV